MPLEISGVVASLRLGYAEAASVEGWTATRLADGTWTLTATLITSNPFWLSQRPLEFEAPYAKGVWRWPVIELQVVEGAPLRATLGRMRE